MESITKLQTHEGLTVHPERSHGRRVLDQEAARRDIDRFHRANGIFLLSELTLLRKAVEAILKHDIAAMLVAQETLKIKE